MNSKGFTLIETLLALAILSIVGLIVIQLFLSSTRTNLDSKRNLKASFLAQQTIEEFKQNFDAKAKEYENGNKTMIDGYSIGVTTKEHKIDDKNLKKLYKIEVVVSFEEQEYSRIEALVSN